MEYLIGIDLGTTGCRCVLFDAELGQVGESYTEYPLIALSDTEIEQDAELWWSLTKAAIKGALAVAGIPGGSVRGMAVSSQGIAFAPVDAAGAPLCNALSWLDARAKEELAEILGRIGPERIYGLTGKRASECFVLPKLLWLRRHRPEIYAAADKFLMAQDFLVQRLCGALVTDHTMATGTLLYELGAGRWSEELLGAFGIDRARLPALARAGSPVGKLRAEVADELGLGRDTIVAVGGQDQKCAALGAGAGVATATVSLGTACAITMTCGRPYADERMRIPASSGLFEGMWSAEGVLNTGAACLRWLRDCMFPNKDYAELSEMAERGSRRDAGVFFYPHLSGASSPTWHAEGAGSFYGLRLNSSAEDMVAALFEGIAFHIRLNLEAMADQGAFEELCLFGGGAKSATWCRIIADITGYPVKVPFTHETASLGAAILAGIGAGLYAGPEEPLRRITFSRRYEPDPARAAMYDEKYRRYRAVEDRLWP